MCHAGSQLIVTIMLFILASEEEKNKAEVQKKLQKMLEELDKKIEETSSCNGESRITEGTSCNGESTV